MYIEVESVFRPYQGQPQRVYVLERDGIDNSTDFMVVHDLCDGDRDADVWGILTATGAVREDFGGRGLRSRVIRHRQRQTDG